MPGAIPPLHGASSCAQAACDTVTYAWSHNFAALTGISLCLCALITWFVARLNPANEEKA